MSKRVHNRKGRKSPFKGGYKRKDWSAVYRHAAEQRRLSRGRVGRKNLHVDSGYTLDDFFRKITGGARR